MATKQVRKLTPEALENIAARMITFFNKNGYWCDSCIFVNGKRYSAYKHDGDKEVVLVDGAVYYEADDIDVRDVLGEYCNPDTISLVFEGPLYHKIYEDYDFVLKLTEKFIASYGLYFELGYQWSMTAYRV